MQTYRHLDHDDAIFRVEAALINAGINYLTQYQTMSDKKLAVNFIFTDYLLEGLGGLRPQITVVNSTDKSSAFKMIGGVFRLVCSNGLVAGDVFDSERIVHRVGDTFERKWNSLPERIVTLIEGIILACQDLEELTEQELTQEQMLQITGNITMSPKAKRKAIEDIVFEHNRRAEDQGNNVWTLFNIINENLRQYSKPSAYQKNNEQLLENIQLLAS